VLDPGAHVSFFFWISVLGILCSCVSIIRIRMKYRNRCENRDFFLSRSHFRRDSGFQTKSGKSRRDRDGYSMQILQSQEPITVPDRVLTRPQ